MAESGQKKKLTRISPNQMIEIRGARQNNLKGINLDIPIGKLNVISGPSGSGKSSLAFQTLYAEGQRRYVETFSPYTRQFFDRMDKPQVDAIHGIPPAIAIEQQNAVKSTRSTVGTITEINDYLKLLFPRICTGYDPVTGEVVEPDTPKSILRKTKERFGRTKSLLVAFGVSVPNGAAVSDFFEFLQQQGYLRVWIFGEMYRVDSPEKYRRKSLPLKVDVIQDRVPASRSSRFLEALERTLDLGKGQVVVVEPESRERAEFSREWCSPESGTELKPPVPSLFNFNHPLGACSVCRGFGRVIGIDMDKAMPDKSLSIAEGLVKAFQGNSYSECEEDLERCARNRGLSLLSPFDELPKEDQDWIINGEGDDPEEAWQLGQWYGVKGFFDWLESRAYKMHIRVFLSRYRNYTQCHACRGSRLKPDALNFRVNGKTLPELWRLSIDDLSDFFETIEIKNGDRSGEMLHGEITSRLYYLKEVGLGYLNLDRPTRTLSGGETERVNLTTCLGASLTNTLFVLDEPTVGLHPRDVGKLIQVMCRLRGLGNTLVVVEHEEAVIRAADHLIDIGPGRGESGGEIVFEGGVSESVGKKARNSLTWQYLTGKKFITTPSDRRTPTRWLTIKRATQHNLKKIDAKIPLDLFCCVTGVSGSGKSTLIHSVLYENLRLKLGLTGSRTEAGTCLDVLGFQQIAEVIMVDQAPLAKTPRSTPAVYTGVFESIRKLFAESPDGRERQVTPGYFSFNSGMGRCARCLGNGFEKVEMQFLSDLYVTCPECEGKRYTPEALEIEFQGKNVDEVLRMTVSTAIEFFFGAGGRKGTAIVEGLQLMADVGLGYLRLGQAVNTLSGGESQRLKLVGHLLNQSRKRARGNEKNQKSNLLIFDEPTTGLHLDDVAMLLRTFDRLVENGDSLVVIEHNPDVIKSADYVIDMGPEAGDQGGHIIGSGTPEEIAELEASHTGRFLRSHLSMPAPGALRVAEPECGPVLCQPSGGKRNEIQVFGARENNLKEINIAIPRDQLVVVTGLSGSGKSTLAFDILFSEGQRRFLDSMSTYARQFVEQMERPDIDHITGLPPTVAIEQRISRGGGKSTVATVTEVWHFLRLLFAKVGRQYSPDTGNRVQKQSISAIVTAIATASQHAGNGSVKVMAPLIKARKGYHTDVAEWAGRQGFEMLLVDGSFVKVSEFERLERFKEHHIDVVVGEIAGTTNPRKTREIVESALRIGKRICRFVDADGTLVVMNTEMCDPETGRSFEELDPRLFSYNSPHGWCPHCRGYGCLEKRVNTSDGREADSQLDAELREELRRSKARNLMDLVPCSDCGGARLNPVARFVRVGDVAIHEIAACSVSQARQVVEKFSFQKKEALIARDIIPEITQRLRFMEEVGLGYLQLDRSATTLSGGESQRIRLAAQLGSNLRGVLYVLDEPTIGLHPRDNKSLLETLAALREKGNSLVVVEHDEETIRRSDHLIDLGPGAGRFGGEVVWQGDPVKLFQRKSSKSRGDNGSPTERVFSDPISHPMRGQRRKLPAKNSRDGWIRIEGASAHNLKNLNIRIPIGRLTVISGISGSGKSSLMRGVVKPAADSKIKRGGGKRNAARAKTWKSIRGAERLEMIYEVDQSPIGKTSRSVPATYVKVFDDIRKLFARIPEARARGYTASRFSFNTEGGRCEACKGNGNIKLEMNFLPTSYVVCDECNGRRYNAPTMEIEYHGKSIADVLDMSIEEAAAFFSSHPKIARTLGLMNETGLGYLSLGQPSPTLSGGEAQRIKLVTELTRGMGRSANARLRQNRIPKSNLYLIEEPSIGLHTGDVVRLLQVLHRLVDDGHTVVVIEHNLEIMAEADYMMDLGPEAGEAGGKLVVCGSPEEVARNRESRTAPFLKGLLGAREPVEKP